MFKKIMDAFTKGAMKKSGPDSDAVRTVDKSAQLPGDPSLAANDSEQSQFKPKRLSDVSQMRLAAYVERTGNTV